MTKIGEFVEIENLKLDTARELVRLLDRLVVAESESHWRPSLVIQKERKEIVEEANKLVERVGVTVAVDTTELLCDALVSLVEGGE